MLNAARAANRVVQVGLHRRIGPHYASGMKFIKEGNVGDIGMVRMFDDESEVLKSPANNPVPDTLDDMYCGQHRFAHSIENSSWRFGELFDFWHGS